MSQIQLASVTRGDIYYVNFGYPKGSAISGLRPAIIIQNNLGNTHAPTLIVAAISSDIQKKRQPTHLFIGKQFGLQLESMILFEQIFTIDKCKLGKHVGHVDDATLKKMDIALSVSLGLRVRANSRNKKKEPDSLM